jgi:hypothetical protein
MNDQYATRDLVQRLTSVISEVRETIKRTSTADLNKKPAPNKWSKKEILGHLIDSGINNLQRFTEIQFKLQPYQVRGYSQDNLVAVNGYQHAAIDEILACWVAINTRITHVIKSMSTEVLALPILLPDGQEKDLGFLINDYIDHMIHHHKQLSNR